MKTLAWKAKMYSLSYMRINSFEEDCLNFILCGRNRDTVHKNQ